MNPTAARFGANLSRCRRLAGLSQEEVSFRASVHRTQISQLERGLRVPRIDTLVKLQFAVGVTVEDLLTGIVWKPGEVRRGGFADQDES